MGTGVVIWALMASALFFIVIDAMSGAMHVGLCLETRVRTLTATWEALCWEIGEFPLLSSYTRWRRLTKMKRTMIRTRIPTMCFDLHILSCLVACWLTVMRPNNLHVIPPS